MCVIALAAIVGRWSARNCVTHQTGRLQNIYGFGINAASDRNSVASSDAEEDRPTDGTDRVLTLTVVREGDGVD